MLVRSKDGLYKKDSPVLNFSTGLPDNNTLGQSAPSMPEQIPLHLC